jgi:spermidine/putrescine transport system substrate-binding protein
MDNEIHYRHLLERYGNGDIDRRTFLGGIGTMAVAGGVTGTAMALFPRSSVAAQAVRFDSYGGVYQAALEKFVLQPFTAKTGISVNQGSFGSPDEFLAKVQADGVSTYNFFTPAEESSCLRFIQNGFATEIDETKIPRLGELMPKCIDSYKRIFNGKLPAVPATLSGVWLGYNRDKIDKAEVESKGFNILLDPKYKGAVSGEDHWLRRIWYGALQTNQDPNNIKDMDVVWEKIRESKRAVLKYYTTGAEQMQLFSSNSIILADAWFVRVYNLKKQGVPIEGYPRTGTYVTFSSFMPLKGSPLDAFYELVDILLRPEVQIPLALETGNSPLLDPSKHVMPKEAQDIPGFDPTGKLEGYHTIDPIYWTSNAEAWQRQYQRVMARG